MTFHCSQSRLTEEKGVNRRKRRSIILYIKKKKILYAIDQRQLLHSLTTVFTSPLTHSLTLRHRPPPPTAQSQTQKPEKTIFIISPTDNFLQFSFPLFPLLLSSSLLLLYWGNIIFLPLGILSPLQLTLTDKLLLLLLFPSSLSSTSSNLQISSLPFRRSNLAKGLLRKDLIH